MGNCCGRYVTIQQGDQKTFVARDGKVTVVKGPVRYKIPKYSHMDYKARRYTANAHQYLVIAKIDGEHEHLAGPATYYLNVATDTSVQVKEAIALSANESLVVYRRVDGAVSPAVPLQSKKKSKKSEPMDDNDKFTSNVQREVIRGPTIHIPAVDEWSHQFEWHGTDRNNKTKKVPKGLKFTKLRVIPDQMYYNINDVRSKDDALITVKLMIFFELKDIERMLDRTHDPIADFINAVTADVVTYASTLTYEEFLQKTSELSELDAYPQLLSRSKSIGYQITKVVYRGYHASNALQQMHDDAIQARTQLRLESETESAAQELADLQLQREFERSKKKQEMQEQETNHRNMISRKAHDEKLFQQQKEHEAELNRSKAANAEKLEYLKELSEMKVDLTQYLTSQYQKPDRLIQIDGGQSGSSAGIHLHDN